MTENNSSTVTSDSAKWGFISEAHNQAAINVRHYHNIAFRLSLFSAGGIAAFTAWIASYPGYDSIFEKLGLTIVVAAFVISIVKIIFNCQLRLNENNVILLQVDKAYECFEKGMFINEESLFPLVWLDKNPKKTHKKLTNILV